MSATTRQRSDAQTLFEETPYTGTDYDGIGSSADPLYPDEPDTTQQKGCRRFCGYRWVTIVLLALGMVIVHAQRVNVSVSLLAVYSYIGDKVGSESAREHLPDTSWTAMQISLLHSGFFGGYLITQIPAALASYRFTAHRAFLGATFCTCALNFALPVLIEKDLYAATMIVRICQGLAEGFLWPASYILAINWSPKPEKMRISGFVAGGSYAGAIFGFPFCGFITHYVGWQYVYYGTASAGLLWCILWMAVAYEKPDQHPKISERELQYIRRDRMDHHQLTSWKHVPWKEMFMSRPFMALCACSFAKGWVFNLLLMQEPTYMHIFGYSIAQNGIWSALPFFFKLVVCNIGGFAADWIVNKGLTDSTNVRKIFNTLGFGTEALCLFSLSFIYDGGVAITMLSVGVSMGGLAVSGWQTNHLDLAPQYAGILVGISQSFSNVAGILSPLVAGYFIQESANLAEAIGGSRYKNRTIDIDIYGWHMIFLVASLIILICCAFYIVFASGEEQEWAKAIIRAAPEEDAKDSLSPINSKISTTVSYQTISPKGADADASHNESTATIENSDNLSEKDK